MLSIDAVVKIFFNPDSKLQFKSSGAFEYEFLATPKHFPLSDTMPFGQLGPPMIIEIIMSILAFYCCNKKDYDTLPLNSQMNGLVSVQSASINFPSDPI